MTYENDNWDLHAKYVQIDARMVVISDKFIFRKRPFLTFFPLMNNTKTRVLLIARQRRGIKINEYDIRKFHAKLH